MKIKYIDKEGTKHTVTFHEDDLEEVLCDAYANGAKEAIDTETGNIYEIVKSS